LKTFKLALMASFLTNAGVLHTIIFNRALGHVFPKEVDSELADITYVSNNPCPRAHI
jgi:hypothetical protein